jgi:hypothetical protein
MGNKAGIEKEFNRRARRKRRRLEDGFLPAEHPPSRKTPWRTGAEYAEKEGKNF